MSPAMAAERREDDMDEGINLEQWLAGADELQKLAEESREDLPELAEAADDAADVLRVKATIMQAALSAYRAEVQP